MKTYSVPNPQYNIIVTIDDNGLGTIASGLKEHLCDSTLQSQQEFQESLAQANALEAFILALACEGYDVSELRFGHALQTTLDAITNNS